MQEETVSATTSVIVRYFSLVFATCFTSREVRDERREIVYCKVLRLAFGLVERAKIAFFEYSA